MMMKKPPIACLRAESEIARFRLRVAKTRMTASDPVTLLKGEKPSSNSPIKTPNALKKTKASKPDSFFAASSSLDKRAAPSLRE